MSSFLIVGASSVKRSGKISELIGTNSLGPDLVVFEGPKSIAEAREVKSTLTRKPYQSDRISVVLAEADQLTTEAQNALLKTLEEPPGQADIYVSVQDREVLLPTVRSRTQLIDLGPAEVTIKPADLELAWKTYSANSLAKLWGSELDPTVWVELARQLLFIKLNSGLLTTSPNLTEFVEKVELTKAVDDLDQDKLRRFLELAQPIISDLKAHVNRKLVLENLTLALHQIR